MKTLALTSLAVFSLSILSFQTLLGQSKSEPIKEVWNELSNQFIRRAELYNSLVNEVSDSIAKKKMSVDKSLNAISKQEKTYYANLTNLLNKIQLPDSITLINVENLNDSLTQTFTKFIIIINSRPEFKTYSSFRSFQSQIEGTENRINRGIDMFNTTCKNSSYVSLYYKAKHSTNATQVKF
jgi:hypothetical protein